MSASTDRVYPLGLPESGKDSRFTYGLVWEVMAVLVNHGYPHTRSGADHVELQQALFRFIYTGVSTPDAPGGESR